MKILSLTAFLLICALIIFGCAGSNSTSGSGGMTGTSGTATGGTTGTGGAAPTGTGTGTATVPPATGGGTVPTTGTTDEARPKESDRKPSDIAITNAVRQKLSQEGVMAPSLQVEVENGKVTLKGSVSNQAEADRIVAMVRTVENVQGVDSQLTVAQQ